MASKKVLIVGDRFVGKTCLLDTFVSGKFPTEPIATVFETNKSVVDGPTETQLNLWDTAGQADYKALRVLIYEQTKCIVMCYAIDNPDSLAYIEEIWRKDINKKNITAPIVLVATKCDMRSANDSLVSTNAGRKMKRKIRAAAFVECSAKDQNNVEEVFVTAARAINEPKKSDSCTIC